MKKIAITGGIGSGKSLAGKYIAEQGYDVFSCDEISAQMLFEPNYISKIKHFFPSVVKNDTIDKRSLAELVFASKEKRLLLETIAHPIIMRNLEEQMNSSKGNFVFAEVPLLFENNFQDEFDYIIVVLRDLESRITSVMQRSAISREEVLKRIDAQFNYDKAKEKGEFSKKCFLIENNSNKEIFKENLLSFLNNVKHIS